MNSRFKGATIDANVRQQMFTKSRKRANRKVPSVTAKVPAWYIRPDGRKP